MDISEIFQRVFAIDDNFRAVLVNFGINLGWFLFFTLVAILAGQFLPSLLRWSIDRFAPKVIATPYDKIVVPLRGLIARTSILIIIAININWFQAYPGLYDFLQFIVYLALIITVAWLLSRLVRQMIRFYGVVLIQRFNKEVDDFLIVGETVANVIIGFFAIIVFANSQNLNLVSVLTGVGIGGIAVAFAAQEVLSQIVGTIVLYLDRPYVPGEYVRANFNPTAEDIYGRVESIGIRSTKIRLAAQNTLLIVPNSLMASMDVENISRGTKVMALLYLDFRKVLNDPERAFVDRVLGDSLSQIYGVEPGSIRIATFEPEDQLGTRARVSFFLLSSSSSSLNLRKRLVEVANQEISKQLSNNQLEFSMEEPMIYVDSPVTK
jgi:MscS family membrane protein